MTQMYTTGFVDPDAWQGGRLPTLEDLFTIRTRSRVRRDLDELTLGPIARRVDEVRPESSTIGVRSLVGGSSARRRRRREVPWDGDRRRHDAPDPAIGLVHAASVGDRWQIASYEVRSRVPTTTISTRRYARPRLPRARLDRDVVHPGDRERCATGRIPRGTRGDSAAHRRRQPREGRDLDPRDPSGLLRAIPGVGTRKINEALLQDLTSW